jgi:ATP-dependent RNA helicase DDX49/DBP8
VLDEADRLFEESLTESMRAIVKLTNNVNQILLATATIDNNFEGKKLQQLLQTQVKFLKHSTYGGIKTVRTASLTQQFVFTPEQLKPCYLLTLLQDNPHYKVIIFVKTCKECTLMSETLKSLKYRAVALHSFMRLNQRVANLGMFRSDQANILVTTDLTSRGIDVPNVNLVINYHLPRKVSDYVHRVGRTARNGLEGEAVSLVTQFEQHLFLKIEQDIGVKIELLKLKDDLELLSQYNKCKREVKIELMSSGVLQELDKKSENKRINKLELKNKRESVMCG